MSEPDRLRRAVRALILDAEDRILLVRFEFQDSVFWATPGGGLQDGERNMDALRRELLEEVGLDNPEIGPAVWRRIHLFQLSQEYDGQIEHFHVVRTNAFVPSPKLSWERLRMESVTDLRWWSLEELSNTDQVLVPRQLAELLTSLLTDGPPPALIDVGV